MALPKFKTQEEIPEAFKSEYVQKDGEWVPKPRTEDEFDPAAKEALRKEREDRKAEKKRADELQAKLDEAAREKEAKDKGITAEELQKIRDAEAQARKPLEEKLAATTAENRKLKLTDRVKAILLRMGGHPDRIDDAMALLAPRTDLTEDGSEIVVFDKAGKATTETIDDFLGKTFKKEKPYLYLGTNASGSGSTGSDASGEDVAAPAANEATIIATRQRVASAF